jgi:hypothetical protein
MSEEYEEGVLLADGFGEALIGIGTQFSTEVAIYDYDKCIRILMERDGMGVAGRRGAHGVQRVRRLRRRAHADLPAVPRAP